MQATKLQKITDNVVGLFSPRKQLERIKIREHLFRYEGAQDSRLRQRATIRPLSAESSLYQRDRIQIMFQARDLMENEALVKSILLKISNYAIGKIKYQSMSGNAAWDKAAEQYFNDWCARCDITGRHSFRVLCQLLLMSGYRDGDAGFVLVNDTLTNEFRLQSIEADRLGNPYDVTVHPDYIGGITIDENGAPVAYKIYKRGVQTSAYTDPVDVPANSFIHYFDPMRMDQYRGISAFAQGINTIRDIHEILESEKLSVKLGSSITGVVKSEMGDALSSDYFKDTVQDPNGNSRNNFIETMEPGQWRYLQPGEDINMFNSDRPSPAFQGFLTMLIRSVALSVNLPYGFVYDLSGLNGPSVRQDSAQAEREFKRVQEVFVEKVLDPIKNRLIARAIENGDLPQPKDAIINKGKWQFPAHVTIDVGRESKAAVTEVQAGMLTLSDWYAAAGKDVEEELEQTAKECKMIHDLAAKYNVDPAEIRMLTPNGQAGVGEQPAEGKATEMQSSDIYKNLSAASEAIVKKFSS